MTMPYIEIGNGEPIIFLHGLGNNKHLWDLQHELSSTYKLIIPDLRGHGENPLKTDITLFNLATDIFNLMDTLSIDVATICGLSMGGLIAFEMYKQNSKRITSLILSNTTSYCVPWLISPKVYENIQDNSEQDILNYIVNHSLHKKTDDTFHASKKSFTIHKQAFIESSKNCSQANYSMLLPCIKVPTLIINGILDKVTPPILAYQMKFGIPHSRFRSLKNGHLSNIENPKEFNNLINDFMQDKEVLVSRPLSLFYNW